MVMLSRKAMMGAQGGAGTPVDPLAYTNSLRGAFEGNIISYVPLADASVPVALDASPNTFNGAYSATGVTLGQSGIGDGRTAALFDGTAGYVNWYTTGLRDAFNPAEGTLMAWIKVPQEVWEDATTRFLFQLRYDGNNYIMIKKVNDRLIYEYKAGATISQALVLEAAETEWMPVALTWSKSAGATGEVIAYRKGVQAAETLTGLGTWASPGLLSSLRTNIGCDSQTPTTPWSGLAAHCLLLDRAATPGELLTAATPFDAPAATSWHIPQFATNTPVMVMTFDDEYETVYTEAYAYMESKGVKGTFYYMTDAMGGTNDPPFVTLEQLEAMDAAGWSIANHTTDQTTLSEVDLATATAKIADAKTALDGWGLTRASMHLSYPNGGYNATARQAAIDAGMLTARRIYDLPRTFPECAPETNYEIMSTFRLGSADSLEEALKLVDQALAEKKIFIIYGHKIMSPDDDTTKWAPWKFRALIDYCVRKSLPFITINDFYDLQSGPLTITRTPAE